MTHSSGKDVLVMLSFGKADLPMGRTSSTNQNTRMGVSLIPWWRRGSPSFGEDGSVGERGVSSYVALFLVALEGTSKAALDVACRVGLAARTCRDALVVTTSKGDLEEKIFKDASGARKTTRVALDEICKDGLVVTLSKVDLDAKKSGERKIYKGVLDAISKAVLEEKRIYKADSGAQNIRDDLDAKRPKDALAVTTLQRMLNRGDLDGKTKRNWLRNFQQPKRILTKANVKLLAVERSPRTLA